MEGGGDKKDMEKAAIGHLPVSHWCALHNFLIVSVNMHMVRRSQRFTWSPARSQCHLVSLNVSLFVDQESMYSSTVSEMSVFFFFIQWNLLNKNNKRLSN